jgi:hypothetical protein
MTMKKIAFAVLMSASAIVASPAAAQNVTGTVNVTGVVAARCSVIESGADSAAFSGTIDLGRLDAADGTLRSELTSATTTSPADAKKVLARVVCTSANPTISVSATKLAIAGAADAGTGYANSIDYVAALRVNTAAATVAEVKFDTGTNTAGTPVTARLGGRIAGGANNNVEVNVSNLRTATGAVLNQGTYNSVISLLITPTL